MRDRDDPTGELLERWYAGDREALGELLRRNLDWMRAQVRAGLSPKLRQRVDSLDLVQEGALRLLGYGPRFRPENEAQFRKLVSLVLVNLIRDHYDHAQAGKRDQAREDPLPSQGLSRVRGAGTSATRPEQAAERDELREWVQVALELVDPEDRRVIVLRQYKGLSFEEVALELELESADAARMRFNRALPRLADKLRELKRLSKDFGSGR